MLAERERDVGEVVARAAVLVHVAAGEHRDLVDRAQQAERPASTAGVRRCAAAACAHGRLAFAGALARPPRDRDLALAGRDRHRGLADDAAPGAAAVADLGEEGDVAEPDVARDVDLAVRAPS